MSADSRALTAFDNEGSGTQSSDVTKILVGLLAGAAIGSLVGSAFTQKGTDIRNRIADSGSDFAGNIKEKLSNLTDAAADKYEAAKTAATDLIDKGKQKVRSFGTTKDDRLNADSSDMETNGIGGPGILLGALIVSVASTIVWSFATERGNQTRRRIADGSRDLANNVKDKVSTVAGNIAHGISNTYQSAKEGAVDLLEKEKNKQGATA